MPLIHCRPTQTDCRVIAIPAPQGQGNPVYGEICKTVCRAATEPPTVVVMSFRNVSMTSTQRSVLDRIARRMERDPRNRGAIITIRPRSTRGDAHDPDPVPGPDDAPEPGYIDFVTNAEKFNTADRESIMKKNRYDRYDDNRYDDHYRRIRRDCAVDMHKLLAAFIRSRGLAAENNAQCAVRCRDLLISPSTLAALTGGNRSVHFVAVIPAGGLAPGASIDLAFIVNNLPAIYTPLGVSTTYCIADFLTFGPLDAAGGVVVVPSDSLMVQVFVNGILQEDFAGGRVRSASTCNTLCGRCFCVGALEVFTVRVTNISAAPIPAGTTIRLQTTRWFPGEAGYICPNCGQCPSKGGGCGCGKKKRPPLSHHPRPGTNIDIDIVESSDVDIDIDADDDDSTGGS